MKYIINWFAIALLGWPAMVVGYLWGAIWSGFKNGVFFYERHEDEAVEKFTKKKAAPASGKPE